MRFATTLTLRSADRAALDGVVAELRELLERKGAEFKGPHDAPTETVRVPLYDGAAGDRRGEWSYPLFTRVIEVVGRERLARSIAEHEFPDRVHVAIEVGQVRRA